MADLNAWSFTGRLTKDAEYKVTSTGKGLLTISVAVNTGWGEHKKTTFVKVNQWGERGVNLKPYLTKGKLVAVSGSLSVNTWQDRNGIDRSELVVDAPSIQLLGSDGPKPAESKAVEEAPRPNTEEEELDSIPF